MIDEYHNFIGNIELVLNRKIKELKAELCTKCGSNDGKNSLNSLDQYIQIWRKGKIQEATELFHFELESKINLSKK